MLEVDLDAWRKKNLSRSPEELVREAIQNILDESPTCFKLDIKEEFEEIILQIEDDCEGGVRDLSTLWTLFKTDKRLKPTSRGRMGRGIKELIIVADKALVFSQNGSISFDILKSKRKELPDRTEKGTCLRLFITEWPSESIDKIISWCQFLIIPENVSFYINGLKIEPREKLEEYDEINLKTVIYDDSLREHEKLRMTTVELYEKKHDVAYIYEMGIPVDVLLDYPYDVNILQRISIPPERNHIRETYKKRLYKQLLERRVSKLTKEEVTADYVGQVIGDSDPEVQDKVIQKRFGANTVVGTNLDHAQNILVSEKGARVVVTGHLSQGWRKAFKQRRPTVKKFMKQTMEGDLDWFGRTQSSEWTPKVTSYEDLSPRDKKIVDFVKWFAEQLEPSYSWRVEVIENSYPGGRRLADCGSEGNGAFLIRLYRKSLNKYCEFFTKSPFTDQGLGIIIHEVSHVSPYKHTQEQYRYIEKLAGKSSKIMLLQAGEIKRKFKQILP